MPAKYLSIEDLVPKAFLKTPRSVVVESGNGMGKTHASAQYSVMIQKMSILDRIYIVETSQKSVENVCNKILKIGGWCVRYIGFEKFCPQAQQLKHIIELGIPLSYVCLLCPYFKDKSRISFSIFSSQISNPGIRVISPGIHQSGLIQSRKVCTHPILRSFVLDPAFETKSILKPPSTPIIVAPYHVFTTHAVIGRWKKFSRRQRKPRRILLIIDEGDSIFYSGLKIEIMDLQFTKEDCEILRKFSPKTRNLEGLIDIYQRILNILRRIEENDNIVDAQTLSDMERLLNRSDPLLRSFERRKKEIIRYVIENNVKTRIFKMYMGLEELLHIENLKYALKTVEKTGAGFTLYDYDYGVRLLFDPEYPFKFFWKIVLSATFPTEKILESSFLSERSKSIIYRIVKRTKTYDNVWTYEIRIFEDDSGPVNRNREIEYSIPTLLRGIKEAIELYRRKFRQVPGGVICWVCNKTQLNVLRERFREFGLKFTDKKKYIEFKLGGVPVLASYLGSPISRGVDLDRYDISIGVGPLLRPPRKIGLLDMIDYSKAVAEMVQACMRIVRSPSPPRPKLVVLESKMLSPFYSQFYPEWFKRLFTERFLGLSSPEGKSI